MGDDETQIREIHALVSKLAKKSDRFVTHRYLNGAGATVVAASWVGVWLLGNMVVSTGVERIEVNSERQVREIVRQMQIELTEAIDARHRITAAEIEVQLSRAAESISAVDEKLSELEEKVDSVLDQLAAIAPVRDGALQHSPRSGGIETEQPLPTEISDLLASGEFFSQLRASDAAVAAGTFETFLSMIEQAGSFETIDGIGPITVFVPTDEAFAALSQEGLQQLFLSVQTINQALGYHIVPGFVTVEDLIDAGAVQTISGIPVDLSDSDGLAIDGAKIIVPDIPAPGGIIHIIDRVRLPQ